MIISKASELNEIGEFKDHSEEMINLSYINLIYYSINIICCAHNLSADFIEFKIMAKKEVEKLGKVSSDIEKFNEEVENDDYCLLIGTSDQSGVPSQIVLTSIHEKNFLEILSAIDRLIKEEILPLFKLSNPFINDTIN